MTRETAAQKGARYVATGRLTITAVNGDLVTAECKGSGQLHHLGHDPRRGWFCDCAARRDCSHLIALRLVTVR